MSETLRINEIFHSIQGEGTRTGRPCVFVRLTGCPLRCRYCDTEYAFREGDLMTLDAVFERAMSYGCDFVEVTGGEPLAQKRSFELMRRLCEVGKTVAVETGGSLDIDGGGACDPRVIRIVDIKTPGSGECERNDWGNIARLRKHDEVKFVICDRADYEWARGVIAEHGLVERVAAVLMSPVFEQPAGLEILGQPGLSMRELAEWILADGLRVVLQVQLHKFIWEPQTRGV